MNDFKDKETRCARLKILSFVNTGVPVQVRPGAPTNLITILKSTDSAGLDAVYAFFPAHAFSRLKICHEHDPPRLTS